MLSDDQKQQSRKKVEMNAKAAYKLIIDDMRNSYLFSHYEARITINNIFVFFLKSTKKNKQTKLNLIFVLYLFCLFFISYISMSHYSQ